VCGHLVGARRGPVEQELAGSIDDEQTAVWHLDGKQPLAERLEPLDRSKNTDHPSVAITDRKDHCDRGRAPDIRRIDLRRVRPPGAAHLAVPVTEGVAPPVDLRRL